jgi:hypothetical protein
MALSIEKAKELKAIADRAIADTGHTGQWHILMQITGKKPVVFEALYEVELALGRAWRLAQQSPSDRTISVALPSTAQAESAYVAATFKGQR